MTIKALYVDLDLCNQVIGGQLPETTKVATGQADTGEFIVGFLSFDRTSRDLHVSKDGKRVKINVKLSK
jgi:hypothetical protein